jgi:predicted RNA-binding Zn-ribbon protein involved in translation (DUF1610 family)
MDEQEAELYCPECGWVFEREEGESESDAYLRHGPECGMPY